MADAQFLNPLYTKQNALRAIGELADKIEKDTHIAVVRCNVGDPTGPTLEESNESMVSYIQKRGPYTGYAPHAGELESREKVANALKIINRLEKKQQELLTADKVFCVDGGTGGLNVALSIFDPSAHDNGQVPFEPKKGKYRKDAVFEEAGKTVVAHLKEYGFGWLAFHLERAITVIAGTEPGDHRRKPPPPAVLVTDPFYPPWRPIIQRNGGEMMTVPLRKEKDYLLQEDDLRKKIEEIRDVNPDRAIVLMYHYPHNPTGKTLTKKEAEKIGTTLNHLMKDYSNLHLIQEDLYLATTRSDLGIYTPLSYLDDNAMKRTMWIHSPSKEGHGQDRGAIVATTDDTLALHLKGATAFSALGMSTTSLRGTARTLEDIAQGIDPRTGNRSSQRNHRYETADYYHDRMGILGKAFLDIENALMVEKNQRTEILDKSISEDGTPKNGIPEGTYYLWPSLKCMEGLPIPEKMRPLFDHDTITSTEDIKQMLAHAYRLGLQPITVAEGEIFTKPNDEFRMRLAAVNREKDNLKSAANTLKGVIGTVVGLDLDKLKVERVDLGRHIADTINNLIEKYPAQKDEFKDFLPSFKREDSRNDSWDVAL